MIQRLIGKLFPNKDDQAHAQMCHELSYDNLRLMPLARWEKRLMRRYPDQRRRVR